MVAARGEAQPAAAPRRLLHRRPQRKVGGGAAQVLGHAHPGAGRGTAAGAGAVQAGAAGEREILQVAAQAVQVQVTQRSAVRGGGRGE